MTMALTNQGLVYLLLVLFSVPLMAADKPLIADIEKTEDRSYLEAIKGRANSGNAVFEYRKYLQISKKGSKQRRQVLLRLAEIELELSEKLLAEDIKSADPNEAEMKQTIASSISLFETALSEYSDESDNDRVLYQLARAYEINARPDQVSNTLMRLISLYPSSAYYIESQFRLAEAYFINRQYSQSYNAYTGVLSRQSEFYDNAQYKRGWSSFKLSKYDAALKDFIALLDSHDFSKEKSLSRIEKELYEDSIRVISLSFAYLQGIDTVKRFFAKRRSASYIKDIYYGLGNHYLKQKRYADTAGSYMAFVQEYKHSSYAPQLALETIEVWQKSRFQGEVLKARDYFSRTFALNSDFWTVNKKEDFPEVIIQLKNNISLLAQYHHSIGQKKNSVAEKKKAVYWYDQYIRSFSNDKATPHLHFLYAELLAELRQEEKAFYAYEAAAYQYAKSKESTESAYAAVMLATVLAGQKNQSLAGKKKWQAAVVSSTLKFSKSYPNDSRLKNILLRLAEIQYEQGRMLEAIEMAEKVIPQSTKEQKIKALLILAHAQFELELYAEAEKSYSNLLTLSGKQHAKYKKIRERVAVSIYKEAELALKSGQSALAVVTFLRLKKAVPESAHIATAEYDAAAELMKNKKWKQALPVLLRFRKMHPGHKLQNDVTTKLAIIYTETQQFTKAAAEYGKIAGFIKGPEKRRVAYYQVAALYQQGGDSVRALNAYQSYIKKYPQPFDIAMETRHKISDLYGAAKNSKAQDLWRKNIIETDRNAGKNRTDRSRYLAAAASVRLADKLYRDFAGLKLKAPFKKNLQRKKIKMKGAVNAFANATKYKVAEVTTEAIYKIGQIYYGFSKDLMQSERPAKLTAEEKEQYDILLEEQAFPFEEKAIEFHNANLNRAKDHVYDDWVIKSVARLGELFPLRYKRTEKLEAVINVP
ncbi:MAG: tetratricopeptide repeat protein [Gammaproteobacteria bacterium]|nr:tetratricopeptide repeat protein [Gammaproteobacteria bacterium]